MMRFNVNAGGRRSHTGRFHAKPTFQRGPKQNPGLVHYQAGSFNLRKNHLILGIAAIVVVFLRFAPDYDKYVSIYHQASALLPISQEVMEVDPNIKVQPIGEAQESLPIKEKETPASYSKEEFLDEYVSQKKKLSQAERDAMATNMEPDKPETPGGDVEVMDIPKLNKEIKQIPAKPKEFPGKVRRQETQKENLYAYKEPRLYLMDKAGKYVFEEKEFEEKVRKIAGKLDVEASWLMAVMYSESQFNSSVKNYKGSGATGLIQFMPFTARELKVSIKDLKKMTPVKQLDYVYKYLDRVKARHGYYQSLTDLYLAILYPRAINKSMNYVMYSKPSITYKQNAGLDVNKDGKVTVKDIDLRMRKKFKTAYFSGRTR
ncbi:MAG: transglycosylase SLT domain-containing protein [Bacteroidota bacterium]